jgi:hypothetical protein
MFPDLTTFEEYEKILREPYNYQPIEIDVGFFGLCSYQPTAWEHVIQSVRRHYPDAPIVLINDGMKQFDYSEIAKKYNCIHIIIIYFL